MPPLDYEITNPDARGAASMFASRDLPAGYLLLDEAPLFCAFADSPTLSTEVLLSAELLLLAGEPFDAFWSLACVHADGAVSAEDAGTAERRTALGIWGTNNYSHTDSEGMDCEAVYAVGSRINHSCWPNCAHSFNQDTHRGEVRCARAVSKGEEISLSYLALLTAGGRVQRKASLMATHRFECLCEACTLGSGQDASDRRRVRIAELFDLGDYDEDGEYYENAVQNLQEILRLLVAEGFDSDMHGMLERGIADILHETGEHNEALCWARRSLKHFTLTQGPGYGPCKEMARYCSDQTLPPIP